MNKLDLVLKYVHNQLINENSGHDFYHALRVYKTSLKISETEVGNQLICGTASLVHDLIDDKLVSNQEEAINILNQKLIEFGYTEQELKEIFEIITTISFKGGNNSTVTNLNAQIVQDADRLDAIGAIGIARTFAYAGAKGNLIYDPTIIVRDTMTYEQYRNNESTAINHFYEKLLKLKDLMNTETGKQLALDRHKFLEDYLEQFFIEWNSK